MSAREGPTLGPRGEPMGAAPDRQAVAALACGGGAYLATVLLGVCCSIFGALAGVGLALSACGLGIGALLKQRGPTGDRRSRGIAWAGLALGALYLLLVAAGAVVLLTLGLEGVFGLGDEPFLPTPEPDRVDGPAALPEAAPTPEPPAAPPAEAPGGP